MEKTGNRRERYNLYYIYAADRQAHFMHPDRAEKIRERILKNFYENIKPDEVLVPPD